MPVDQDPGEFTDTFSGRRRREHLDMVAELEELAHGLDISGYPDGNLVRVAPVD